MPRLFAAPAIAVLALLAGCPDATDSGEAFVRGEQPAYEPQAPQLRRLTYSQYVHSIDDLFGEGLVLPSVLEPDSRVAGLYAVGASVTSISSLGVERYESAAFDIAEQVLADPARHAALVGCTPADAVGEACARTTLTTFGEAAWRRPLTEAELEALVAVHTSAATTLGTFEDGLTYALAAVLQSPHFLFRPELGEDDGAGGRRFTAWELASRLSYFLWDGPPDAELRAAAASGELVTDAGIDAQIDRMLDDERARRGVRAFFVDMLHLDELDSLTKDPLVYVYMSSELGASAREQTLLDVEALVLDEDTDFRTFLTGTDTHLDRTLAALYDVPAPAREGFGAATLPSSGGRRGFLGQASFLALQAHATSTSVTRRGQYLREVLLCQELPSAPAGLNTSIPEATEAAPTMRDRVAQHNADPTCAACHELMDPIGLGFENFDGVGRWRTEESGVVIDPSGDLDGADFADAWELAGLVADNRAFTGCVSDTLLAAAVGHGLAEGEEDLADWHTDGLKESGYRVKALLRDIARGPAFRRVGSEP